MYLGIFANLRMIFKLPPQIHCILWPYFYQQLTFSPHEFLGVHKLLPNIYYTYMNLNILVQGGLFFQYRVRNHLQSIMSKFKN